jgi:hypothetical protein
MKTFLATASALALVLGAGSAGAGVFLNSGQFGGLGVHSTPHESAMSVTGLAGTDLVTISTDNDNIIDTSGNGESDYDADSGLFDDLMIAFTNSYDRVTFNLKLPSQATSNWTLSVNGGAFNFTGPVLGNGENKFIVSANGHDAIHSLAFTFDPGVIDVRQIRVGNIVAVPEPGAWALMLAGFGGMGAFLRRRRAALAA